VNDACEYEAGMLPPYLAPRRVGSGLTVHLDEAALAEYEIHRAAYDQALALAAAAHEPMLHSFGQPCPVLLHGLAGCWRHGHELKKRDHGFDLGDAAAGICFHGNFHYEGHPDVEQAIVIINLPAVLLPDTSSQAGASNTRLASQLSRAFCKVLQPCTASSSTPHTDPELSEEHGRVARDPDQIPLPAGPTSPRAPMRLARADVALPDFMSSWRLGSLTFAFDAAALAEYREEYEAYDEIFSRSDEVLRPLVHALGQCPIWLHGLQGCWVYGHEKKLREHGVDLGEAADGLAWHGNMHYHDYGDQEESVFLVNLPRAVLCHPMVLVHELTHHFHLKLGPARLPMITRAYERMGTRKELILKRFHVSNRGQFEYTLSNELEFLAYMMEAYHACALHAPLRGTAARRMAFAAPAFPTTRAELSDLDREFDLGIIAALTDAMAVVVSSGEKTSTN
jgi:hypothetical protein